MIRGTGLARLILALFAAFFAVVSAAAADDRALEIFVLINADNDLVTVDDSGKAVHQGEVLFKAMMAAGLKTTGKTALHVLIDPNSLVSGEGFDRTRLIRCVSGACQKETLDLPGGESDLTDVSFVKKLLSGSKLGDAALKVFAYWGHGNGFADVPSFDHSAPEKPFSALAYAPALKAAGVSMAIFDACAMGSLEVMAAMEGFVRYVVASPYDLPVEGLQWDGLADILAGHVDARFANRDLELQVFLTLFRDTGRKFAEMSIPFGLVLFDTDRLDALLDALNPFVKAFKETATADVFADVARLARLAEARVALGRFVRAAAEAASLDATPVTDAIRGLARAGYGPIAMIAPERLEALEEGKAKREIRVAISSRAPWISKFELWSILRALEGV